MASAASRGGADHRQQGPRPADPGPRADEPGHGQDPQQLEAAGVGRAVPVASAGDGAAWGQAAQGHAQGRRPDAGPIRRRASARAHRPHPLPRLGHRVRHCPRGLDYCVPGGWVKGTSVGMAGGSSPGRSGGSSGGISGPGSGAGWSVGGSGGISGSGLSDIGFSSVNRCQDKALIVGVFRL